MNRPMAFIGRDWTDFLNYDDTVSTDLSSVTDVGSGSDGGTDIGTGRVPI